MHACGRSCVHMCVRSSWKVPRFPRMASQYGVPGTCEGDGVAGLEVWGWDRLAPAGAVLPADSKGGWEGGDGGGPWCREGRGFGAFSP